MKNHTNTYENPPARHTGPGAADAPAERSGGGTAATFAAVAREWQAERAAPGWIRPVTLQSEAQILAAHLLPALGDLAIDAIAPGALREALEGAPLAICARQALTRVARQVFSHAVARGLCSDNPVRALVPVPPACSRYGEAITPEEEAAVLAQLDAPLCAFFILSLDIGARPGELLALKREDVDLEHGTVTIRPQVACGGRVVALSARARAVVEELIGAGQDRLFVDAEGRPYSEEDIRKRLRQAMRRAGVAGPIHRTRLTCAARWLRAGRSPARVAAELGTSCPERLERLVEPMDDPHAS